MTAPAWIAIAGPTASGKTALALRLGLDHPIEVVSVDSALVYRGMDIGTAKPTATERGRVPHHLIDLLDPSQTYSAAAFVRDATRLVHDIRARGRLPVLVGGTMLYFKALFDGLDDMPAADPALRDAIEQEAETQGWPAMHKALAEVDPATAARLAPQDSQRIARALEVFRSSGQPLSAFQQRLHRAENGPPAIQGLPGVFCSLEPQDRSWLHARIAERFDAMLAAGFLNEVRALRARSDLHPDLPSMRCVGYRQAWHLLDATAPDTALDLGLLKAQGVAATRQLAKRQLTWLRGMPHRQVWACDGTGVTERVAQALLARLTHH